MIASDISHYRIETNTEILKNVKIINVQNNFVQLEDSTEIPLLNITSVSSYSSINLLLPTIAGGVSGFAGGTCGLFTGTLLGFGFAEKGKGVGSTAAPWAALFTWKDNKQLPSLYIGMILMQFMDIKGFDFYINILKTILI